MRAIDIDDIMPGMKIILDMRLFNKGFQVAEVEEVDKDNFSVQCKGLALDVHTNSDNQFILADEE